MTRSSKKHLCGNWFTTETSLHVAIPFVLLGLVSGCSKKSEPASVVNVRLPALTGTATSHKPVQASSASGWGYSNPSTIGDVKCFALAVETPEKSGLLKCTDSSGNEKLKPNILVGPLAAGSMVSVEVPSGKSRKFSVIGFAAASVADCTAMGTVGPDRSKLSEPHLLGATVVDLAPGPNEVTIRAQFTSGNTISECTPWGGDTGGPQPNPTVNFDLATQSATEGGTVSVAINLDFAPAVALAVPYTVAGSASGADHSLVDGSISVAAGSDSGLLSFSITDDIISDPSETVEVQLQPSAFLDVGANDTHTITITDNDVGPYSPAQSLISVSSASIMSGNSATVTLTLKDASGLPLSTGGASVAFSASGGTATGSFSGVTDNGDGTYTSQFLGNTAGTATTIGATVNSVAVTSTAPSISVAPGSLSLTNSMVTLSNSTVQSGSNLNIFVQTRDNAGNLLTAGGHAITFSYSSGTSTANITGITDLGNGTYTAVLNGVLAGTASTVQTFINSAPVTSTPPTFTVTPGPISVATSLITVSPANVYSGYISTLTLTSKDAAGNLITTGGHTVALAYAGGVSTGVLSATTDVGDGTYTRTFTGRISGSATTITATIDTIAVTSAAPTITVDVQPLTVAATYPTNGAKWNDFIQFDNSPGTNSINQDDVACTGAEAGFYGELNGCVHAGELRKVVLSGYVSCAQLDITDALNAFDWACDATSGTATFFSTGLKKGVGLSSLVNSAAWLNNSVTVKYLTSYVVAQSTPTAWWSNSVLPISANAGAISTLSTASAVYTINSNLITRGLVISADRISVVTLPTFTVSSDGSLSSNMAVNDCYTSSVATAEMLCAGNRNFLWLEMSINGTNGANALLSGLHLKSSKFSRIHKTKILNLRPTANAKAAIEIEDSAGTFISSSMANGVGQKGGLRVTGVTASSRNRVADFTVERNTDATSANQSLIFIDTYADHTRLNTIRASRLNTTGTGSRGIIIKGTNTSLTESTISNIASNNASGVYLTGASNTIISQATISATANAAIEIDGTSTVASTAVTHITAPNHAWNGLYLSGSINNLLVHNFFTSNNDKAIESAAGTGSGISFHNIVADSSAGGIAVNLAGSHTVAFSGFFNKGTASPSCSGGGLSGTCAGSVSTLAQSFATSVIGKVTTDDAVNTFDTNGIAASAASITNWTGFENLFRSWGIYSANPFPDTSLSGSCQTGQCQIWDWRAKIAGNLENRSATTDGTSANNPAFVASSPCAALLGGSMTLTGAGTTFLKYAAEINDDLKGNNNGLCESGEACIYTPNIGAYQGEGDPFSGGTCNFANGIVTGVTVYKYPVTSVP